MGAFGLCCKKIVNEYGLKYRAIADAVSYDVSYVSKWVNSDILPASTAIEGICCTISRLAVAQSSVDVTAKKSLQKTIECALREAYIADEKLAERCKDKRIMGDDMAFDRRATVFSYLQHMRTDNKKCTLTIMADFSQLAVSELVFLIDVLNYIRELDFPEGNVRLLFAENSFESMDDGLRMVALINLMMVRSNVTLTCSRALVLHLGLVILGESFLYYAQCWKHGRWVFEGVNTNTLTIEELSATLNREIAPTSQHLYHEVPFDNEAMNEGAECAFRRAHGYLLVGMLMSQFCGDSLFNSVTEGLDEGLRERCVMQRRNMLSSLEQGETIECIIYKHALINFISEGKLFVGGRTVDLSIPDRHRLLQDICCMVERFPNLRIKVTDDYIVRDVSHRYLPLLFLDRKGCCFVSIPQAGISHCCQVKEHSFRHALKRSFENLWEGGSVGMRKFEHVITDYLDDLEAMIC